MNILNLDTISKNFGDKALFSDLTFGLSAGERVGLIGVNGSGKTTLFKIIAGLEPPDSGTVTVRGAARVAYLPQDPTMDPAQRVLDYVYGDENPALQLLRGYTEVTQQLEQAPEDAALLAELSHLSDTMTRTNAWDGEVAARTILSRLGIRTLDTPLGQLSGGQRKRVALARVLIEQPDLLILDEPTNHIDPDTIAWLEGYLANLPGALLLITHDRYFLDRVATRIIELDDHTIYSYPGNYAQFVEARLERARLQEQADVVLRNAAKRELAWLRAGVQARTTKQKARVQRATALVNTERRETPRDLEMSQVGRRMGKQLIELREVSKALGGRPVIENFSLELARDDRLGVIGPNGMGKSTLLNLIAGRLQPDSGEVVVGETMHIAYYDQTSSELDLSQRLIDYVSDGAAVITTADGSTLTAGQMLERFLFPPHQHWSTIESLSGGERRRLYLLRVLLRNPNILLLDEPSNDLDVQTIAVLEEYLEYFPGAVIVVSHDRALLDNVAEHLLVFEAPGQIRRFPGDYSTYREQRQRELREAEDVVRRPAAAAQPTRSERPRKLSFKEQRLLEQLEQQIARLEQEQSELNSAINAAGADYTAIAAHAARLEQSAQELEATFDQWAALAERVENGS